MPLLSEPHLPCRGSTRLQTTAAPLSALADPPFTGRRWLARLQLELVAKGGRSVFEQISHSGPLRIQRPFYPEGHTHPHVYLLHPPGGLVAGDILEIDLQVRTGAGVLVTAPSAARVYRSDVARHPQTQIARLKLEANSLLEWMPLETIVFDGAAFDSCLEVESDPTAKFFIWEMAVLGRGGALAPFRYGDYVQRLLFTRAQIPLLTEINRIHGGDSFQDAAWGLRGHTVFGSWFCQGLDEDTARLVQASLRARTQDGVQHCITWRDGLLIGRALANTSELLHHCFIEHWQTVRPALCGRDACRPRVWAT